MNNMTIAKIRELMQNDQLSERAIEDLRQDERKGVQQIIRSYDRFQQKKREQKEKFDQMLEFDNRFRQEEDDLIAGIDEAGRGPLAGPVVSAAVILPLHFTCYGLTDSKQLSEKERNMYYEKIIKEAIDYSIAVVSNDEIDQLNILEATKKSMQDAMIALDPKPTLTLVDAVDLSFPPYQTKSIIKGDAKSISIAAASILAKVYRDRLMNELDQKYPAYGFKNNKGYGSKDHLNALQQFGPTPAHRLSFSPVQNALKNNLS